MGDVLQTIWCWLTDTSYAALLVKLIVFDVFTGVLVAIRDHKIDSTISSNGMFKKAAMLLSVLVAYALQPYAAGSGFNPAEVVAIGLCIPEGLSIVENLGELGVKVPWIAQFFARLQAAANTDNDKPA
jgi:toxin secretion/phage lysis holin